MDSFISRSPSDASAPTSAFCEGEAANHSQAAKKSLNKVNVQKVSMPLPGLNAVFLILSYFLEISGKILIEKSKTGTEGTAGC